VVGSSRFLRVILGPCVPMDLPSDSSVDPVVIEREPERSVSRRVSQLNSGSEPASPHRRDSVLREPERSKDVPWLEPTTPVSPQSTLNSRMLAASALLEDHLKSLMESDKSSPSSRATSRATSQARRTSQY
jgi:hypothetical protein